MTYLNDSYLYNVAVGFDCFVNALIGGTCRETLSSRTYRNAQKYWYAKLMMYFLDFIFRPWEKEHCKASYEFAYKHGDCPSI